MKGAYAGGRADWSGRESGELFRFDGRGWGQGVGVPFSNFGGGGSTSRISSGNAGAEGKATGGSGGLGFFRDIFLAEFRGRTGEKNVGGRWSRRRGTGDLEYQGKNVPFLDGDFAAGAAA